VALEVDATGPERVRQALESARSIGHRSLECSMLVAAATDALRACGGDARAPTQAALAFAREHGLITPRLTSPEALADLCAFALEEGIEAGFAEHIVRARSLPPPRRAAGLESWPWRVKVRALGRFALFRDGVPVDFPGRTPRRQLELLKLVVARGPGPVPVDAIAVALWEEAEGDRAAHAFETTLSRLRKLVGEDILVLRDGAVALNQACCWVDAWALDHLLDRADAALTVRGRLDVEGLLACSGRAVALYRGRLLATHHDAPWVVRARERLRARLQRHLAAVRERCGPPGVEWALGAQAQLVRADPGFGPRSDAR
jgi:LuxR family maltose regulon positive regulatory protein